MIGVLLWVACHKAPTPDSPPAHEDSPPESVADSDSPTAHSDSPEESTAPDDSDSPVDTDPPTPAALRLLAGEVEFPSAESGMRLRAYLGLEDADGEPLACAEAPVALSLDLCPDADCGELWPVTSDTLTPVCGDAPTLAFVVAPPPAEAVDALRSALLAADETLRSRGGSGTLVLATSPPTALPLSEAATAALGANDDPSGALSLARDALRGADNRALVLVMPAAADATAWRDALDTLTPGGAGVRVIGAPDALAGLDGQTLLLRPTTDSAQELERAARAQAEAGRVLLRNPERTMDCGTLGVVAVAEQGDFADTRLWSQRRSCPTDMDAALQDQFFVDPMGSGLHQHTWRYGFGPRRFNDGTYSFHPGIDMEAPEGDPIYAVAPGVVIQAGAREGYDDSGNFVVLDHGGGLRSWYLHMRDVNVSVGQTLGRGEAIGTVGSTGASWAHLHFSLTLCPSCDLDSLGHYSTQTLNPAWLLPRPESGAHTVALASLDTSDPQRSTLTVELTAPGEEMDFNRLDIALGGVFSDALDFDARAGCANRSDPTDGIWTVDPSTGPWTSGVGWTITVSPIDLRGGDGSVLLVASDTWGNEASAP